MLYYYYYLQKKKFIALSFYPRLHYFSLCFIFISYQYQSYLLRISKRESTYPKLNMSLFFNDLSLSLIIIEVILLELVIDNQLTTNSTCLVVLFQMNSFHHKRVIGNPWAYLAFLSLLSSKNYLIRYLSYNMCRSCIREYKFHIL